MTERTPLLETFEPGSLENRVALDSEEKPWMSIPTSSVRTISTNLSSRTKEESSFDRFRRLLGGSFLNIFLIFLPLEILGSIQGWSDINIFALNLTVLLPLANLLYYITEGIALPLGEPADELLGLVMPHIFPLLVMMGAILNGEVQIIQPFVAGSILANLLLGLGGSFVAAGVHCMEGQFIHATTLTDASVLYFIAVPFAIISLIPKVGQWSGPETQLQTSHVFAIIIVVIYFIYQLFQIRTHHYLWDLKKANDNSNAKEEKCAPKPMPGPLILQGILLVFVLISMWYCTKGLFDAVGGVVSSTSITRNFIGLACLPLVTNISHYTKVYRIAYKQELDTAISLILANNAHLALFDLPFLCLYGWYAGFPVTLDLGGLSTTLMIICIIISARLVVSGKSNYLVGAMYLALYIIIMSGFYLSPNDGRESIVP